MSDALTGPIGAITLGQVALVVVPLAAFLGWLIYKAIPAARRIFRVLDDFTGAPDRNGQKARPGLIERQAASEAQMKAVQEGLKRVVYELRPNSGESFRDHLSQRFDGLEAKFDGLDTSLAEFKSKTEAETARIHREMAQHSNDEIAAEVKTRMGADKPTED